MARIIILTLIIHFALNGLLSAAYITLLDEDTRQAVDAEIQKIKGMKDYL